MDAAPCAGLPTKLANGMAGMYWPNVPLAVRLNVREEAKVSRFCRPFDDALDVAADEHRVGTPVGEHQRMVTLSAACPSATDL